MLAPMMIPIACFSFIIPEFTKPMTMTVVADEDWMTLVTAVPRATPLSGVLVMRYRNASSLLPATSFRPSPIRDIPNKNSATPESKDKTIENIAIIFSSVVFSSCVRAERTPSVFLPFLNFLFIHFLHCLFYYAILMARLQHWIKFCTKKILPDLIPEGLFLSKINKNHSHFDHFL